MLKRLLIVAAAVLATHSGAALADNNWTFDDEFWSKRVERTSQMQGESSNAFRQYEQVDAYNS